MAYAIAVSKHRAPEGALRPKLLVKIASMPLQVSKHRAPEGALRRGGEDHLLPARLSASTAHLKVH